VPCFANTPRPSQGSERNQTLVQEDSKVLMTLMAHAPEGITWTARATLALCVQPRHCAYDPGTHA